MYTGSLRKVTEWGRKQSGLRLRCLKVCIVKLQRGFCLNKSHERLKFDFEESCKIKRNPPVNVDLVSMAKF